MGSKVTIPPLTNPENSSFPTALNSAIDVLSDEFDKVVYRDGSFDLSGSLDASSYRIYNLGAPIDPNDAVRLADIQSLKGDPGDDAPLPNFTFQVTTLAPDTDATLLVTGVYPDIHLALGVPRGSAGASGALSDGVFGDITVSGSGTVLSVSNDSITFAKMQNLPSSGVIGSTGSGDPSLLSFPTVKSSLSLTKSDVGLSNVDNTADLDKVVSNPTQAALAGKSPAFLTVTSISSATTLTNTHNNNLIKFTGSTSRVVTLNSSPTAGFSAIVAHRGTSASWTLSASSGIYLNGATSTVTNVTVAPGAHFTLIHEGSGVWTADGKGLS